VPTAAIDIGCADGNDGYADGNDGYADGSGLSAPCLSAVVHVPGPESHRHIIQ
jgi:hypothetical protein